MPTAKSSKRSTYSLQITPAGLMFSIMVMLVAVLALSSGNNLLYVLVAVLVATLALSLFASRSILSRVDVELRYPERTSAGETVCFDLTIGNRRRLFPVLSLTATLIEQSSWSRRLMRVEHGYLPLLPRRTEAQVRAERCFLRRGVYRLRGFRLETRSPFGFFEHRRLMPVDGQMRIHPLVYPLTDFESLRRRLPGQEESLRKGSGGDLYAIRDAQGRDPHHHVDWKASARANRLMVREFTNEDQWQMTIILDCVDEGREGSEQYYETAIAVAASLADELSRRGAQIQLLTPSRTIPFGSGSAQRLAILDLLAELPVYVDQESRRHWWGWIFRLPGLSWLARDRGARRGVTVGDHDWPDSPGWYLERLDQLRAGSALLIVPTAERRPQLGSAALLTVIACDELPPEYVAAILT